ncbi:SMI1/KNR4 family protein [Pontibacter pudoricolor]|uniref:SMI1/KNR4 family protein n=1 Tax=Pontibacter pudoricolor TaxID=2694930 RepID=UPI001391157E|nr:SMI1/KNR4 family protein [Pontibacter pudoricolor]
MENNLQVEIEMILKELYSFSNKILFLGNKITDKRLELFEKKISFDLPLEFKLVLKRHNGFSLAGTAVVGIGEEFKEASLDKLYDFEHLEVGNKMPREFLPFSPDGRGNHYCLDLSKNNGNTCPVVFWQWDYDYKNKDEIETSNLSFLDWVREVMIEWTLDVYDYEGNEL